MSQSRGGGRGRGGRGGGGGDNRDCFNCGKTGHQSRDCPQPRRTGGAGGGGGGLTCFNCGERGHRNTECPKPPKQGGRGQTTCFKCGQTGHRKDDCPQQRGGAGGDGRPRGGYSGQGGQGQGYRGQGSGDSAGSPLKKQRKELVTVKAVELECKAKKTFVKRPNVGSNGSPIEIIANHFQLKIKDINVFHYHIEMTPMGREASAGDGAAAKSFSRPGSSGQPPESANKLRKLRQKENRLIFEEFVKQNTGSLFPKSGNRPMAPVYDGKATVYTARRLAQDLFETKMTVKMDVPVSPSPSGATTREGRDLEVKVLIKLTQQIDLSAISLYFRGKTDSVPREAYQALDVILRYGPTSNRIPIGNSLYPEWNDSRPYSDGRLDIDKKVFGQADGRGTKQVVFGHYQSTRLTKVGPTLLVDRSATAFYAGGSLMQFLAKLMESNENDVRLEDRRQIEGIKRELKGLRIYTNHLGYQRNYTIKELTYESADKQKFAFKEDDGKERPISVKEYFKKQYKKDINNTRVPCVIPQASKMIYLPLELCYVHPNQPVPRSRITPQNTSQMVRTCGAQSPVQRFDEICKAVDDIKADSSKYLHEFNIDIDNRPLQLTGRKLPAPQIDGVDRRAAKHINVAIELKGWVFVNLCDDRRQSVTDEHMNEFERELCGRAAGGLGLKVHRPVQTWKYDVFSHRGDLKKFITSMFTAAKAQCTRARTALQMILFIIPEDSSVYNTIKLVGDIHEGIVTQCVLAKNVFRPPKGGVQSNLLLKINTKLGGINRILKHIPDKPQVLRDANRPVMIIGADVTHPAPADKLDSSVAACIGSFDENHCKYAASIRVQERSTRAQAVEMIKEFDLMIKDLLNVYMENRKCYPKHIIYYRDGVSESQFEQVLDHEMKKLLEGCRALGFTPDITFITVQKRHHTRFRPLNERNGDGPKGNIPPGTTVDTHVVHPTDYDFYLCSHKGIQGTSRPTHYYVLHDDKGFNADDLQKLTYYLCYTYARCDTPISIPAPVQYAHLAAYRARGHIIASNGTVGDRRRDENEDERRRRERELAVTLNRDIKVNNDVKQRMYYC